ncbi:uncharacterized protein LOC135394744 [Ornithodoros turicata]|uniref:uncharacterized protein LOC135394744 n=1 Tax=Ornithodoros turicata TaxID=34597 RepID=UPI0031387108
MTATDKTSVEVVVENQVFQIERRLLSKHSIFFRECLGQDKNKNKNKLKLSGISAETFNILLDYMKTGQLNITPDNASDIFIAALRLHMSDAVKRCIKMNVATTPVGVHVLKYSAARRLRLQEEEQRSFNYLITNFLSVSTTKEFLDMNIDDLMRLLSAESLGCNCEYEVFEAGMRWLDYNPRVRYKHGDQIMSQVMFHNMDLTQLHQCHENPGVAQMPEVRHRILNAINSWLINEKWRNEVEMKGEAAGRDIAEEDTSTATQASDREGFRLSSSAGASATCASSDTSLLDKPQKAGTAGLVIADAPARGAQHGFTGDSERVDTGQVPKHSAQSRVPRFFTSSSHLFDSRSVDPRAYPTNTSGSIVEEEMEERHITECRTEEVRTIRRIRRIKTKSETFEEENVWVKRDGCSTLTLRYKGPTIPSQEAASMPGEREEFTVNSATFEPETDVSHTRYIVHEATPAEVIEKSVTKSYESSERSRKTKSGTSVGEEASQVRPDTASTSTSGASEAPSIGSVGVIGGISENAEIAVSGPRKLIDTESASLYSLPFGDELRPETAPAISSDRLIEESSGFDGRVSLTTSEDITFLSLRRTGPSPYTSRDLALETTAQESAEEVPSSWTLSQTALPSLVAHQPTLLFAPVAQEGMRKQSSTYDTSDTLYVDLHAPSGVPIHGTEIKALPGSTGKVASGLRGFQASQETSGITEPSISPEPSEMFVSLPSMPSLFSHKAAESYSHVLQEAPERDAAQAIRPSELAHRPVYLFSTQPSLGVVQGSSETLNVAVGEIEGPSSEAALDQGLPELSERLVPTVSISSSGDQAVHVSGETTEREPPSEKPILLSPGHIVTKQLTTPPQEPQKVYDTSQTAIIEYEGPSFGTDAVQELELQEPPERLVPTVSISSSEPQLSTMSEQKAMPSLLAHRTEFLFTSETPRSSSEPTSVELTAEQEVHVNGSEEVSEASATVEVRKYLSSAGTIQGLGAAISESFDEQLVPAISEEHHLGQKILPSLVAHQPVVFFVPDGALLMAETGSSSEQFTSAELTAAFRKSEDVRVSGDSLERPLVGITTEHDIRFPEAPKSLPPTVSISSSDELSPAIDEKVVPQPDQRILYSAVAHQPVTLFRYDASQFAMEPSISPELSEDRHVTALAMAKPIEDTTTDLKREQPAGLPAGEKESSKPGDTKRFVAAVPFEEPSVVEEQGSERVQKIQPSVLAHRPVMLFYDAAGVHETPKQSLPTPVEKVTPSQAPLEERPVTIENVSEDVDTSFVSPVGQLVPYETDVIELEAIRSAPPPILEHQPLLPGELQQSSLEFVTTKDVTLQGSPAGLFDQEPGKPCASPAGMKEQERIPITFDRQPGKSSTEPAELAVEVQAPAITFESHEPDSEILSIVPAEETKEQQAIAIVYERHEPDSGQPSAEIKEQQIPEITFDRQELDSKGYSTTADGTREQQRLAITMGEEHGEVRADEVETFQPSQIAHMPVAMFHYKAPDVKGGPILPAYSEELPPKVFALEQRALTRKEDLIPVDALTMEQDIPALEYAPQHEAPRVPKQAHETAGKEVTEYEMTSTTTTNKFVPPIISRKVAQEEMHPSSMEQKPAVVTPLVTVQMPGEASSLSEYLSTKESRRDARSQEAVSEQTFEALQSTGATTERDVELSRPVTVDKREPHPDQPSLLAHQPVLLFSYTTLPQLTAEASSMSELFTAKELSTAFQAPQEIVSFRSEDVPSVEGWPARPSDSSSSQQRFGTSISETTLLGAAQAHLPSLLAHQPVFLFSAIPLGAVKSVSSLEGTQEIAAALREAFKISDTSRTQGEEGKEQTTTPGVHRDVDGDTSVTPTSSSSQDKMFKTVLATPSATEEEIIPAELISTTVQEWASPELPTEISHEETSETRDRFLSADASESGKEYAEGVSLGCSGMPWHPSAFVPDMSQQVYLLREGQGPLQDAGHILRCQPPDSRPVESSEGFDEKSRKSSTGTPSDSEIPVSKIVVSKKEESTDLSGEDKTFLSIETHADDASEISLVPSRETPGSGETQEQEVGSSYRRDSSTPEEVTDAAPKQEERLQETQLGLRGHEPQTTGDIVQHGEKSSEVLGEGQMILPVLYDEQPNQVSLEAGKHMPLLSSDTGVSSATPTARTISSDILPEGVGSEPLLSFPQATQSSGNEIPLQTAWKEDSSPLKPSTPPGVPAVSEGVSSGKETAIESELVQTREPTKVEEEHPVPAALPLTVKPKGETKQPGREAGKAMQTPKRQFILQKTRIIAVTPTHSVELIEESVTPGIFQAAILEESESSSNTQKKQREKPVEKNEHSDDDTSVKESSDNDTPNLKGRVVKRKHTRSAGRLGAKSPVVTRTRIFAGGPTHSVEMVTEKSVMNTKDLETTSGHTDMSLPPVAGKKDGADRVSPHQGELMNEAYKRETKENGMIEMKQNTDNLSRIEDNLNMVFHTLSTSEHLPAFQSAFEDIPGIQTGSAQESVRVDRLTSSDIFKSAMDKFSSAVNIPEYRDADIDVSPVSTRSTLHATRENPAPTFPPVLSSYVTMHVERKDPKDKPYDKREVGLADRKTVSEPSLSLQDPDLPSLGSFPGHEFLAEAVVPQERTARATSDSVAWTRETVPGANFTTEGNKVKSETSPRKRSAEASPMSDRGAAPVKAVKRKVVRKTISRRRESTRSLTYQGMGTVERTGASLQSMTTQEVLDEYSEESYDPPGTILPQSVQSMAPPLASPIASPSSTELGAQQTSISKPCSRDSPSPKPKKNYSVAIRVTDDYVKERGSEDCAGSDAPHEQPSDHLNTSAPHMELGAEKEPAGRKLDFGDSNQVYEATAPKDDADNDDDYPPSLNTFKKFGRKDSIAVTKIRMLRAQASEGEDEVEDVEEDYAAGQDKDSTKHHLSFQKPTVIALSPEASSREVSNPFCSQQNDRVKTGDSENTKGTNDAESKV